MTRAMVMRLKLKLKLKHLFPAVAFFGLTACVDPSDWDLRNIGDNRLNPDLTTQQTPEYLQPDTHGVISYPSYQVAIARSGDTVRSLAQRLGYSADALARYNGLDPDVRLRSGEIIALPNGAPPADATVVANGGSQIDVTSLAADAIERASRQRGGSFPETNPAANGMPALIEPVRHRVAAGESAYTIARLYSVPVRSLAELNGLDASFSVRERQILLIPTLGATQPRDIATPVTQPGQGSQAPTPPSAFQPLPEDTPSSATTVDRPQPPAGRPQTTQAANLDAPLIFPLRGKIIRAYEKGVNEGIDIAVSGGTNVKAAAAGTVAAVTTDTNGVAIVVLRHADSLLTVYFNLENVTISRNDQVAQGQVIGAVKAGDPSFLHFEVRKGLESVDPIDFVSS